MIRRSESVFAPPKKPSGFVLRGPECDRVAAALAHLGAVDAEEQRRRTQQAVGLGKVRLVSAE